VQIGDVEKTDRTAEKNIFCLDVSVGDAALMAVCNGLNDLSHDCFGRYQRKITHLGESIAKLEQVSPRIKVHPNGCPCGIGKLRGVVDIGNARFYKKSMNNVVLDSARLIKSMQGLQSVHFSSRLRARCHSLNGNCAPSWFMDCKPAMTCTEIIMRTDNTQTMCALSYAALPTEAPANVFVIWLYTLPILQRLVMHILIV